MERLTKRISENIIELSARANPIQYNGSAQRVHIKHPFWNVFNKLCDYEDAEEEGLLLRLPCKPGDIVWILISSTKEIKSFKVSKITIAKNHDTITMTDKSIFTVWGKNWDEYFNHFMFATKEEAEQALQQIQEET